MIGEEEDPNNLNKFSEPKETLPLPKVQNLKTTESGSLSHLTSFRQRKDQGSRSSSRRGSGIFAQKVGEVDKIDKEEQPLLQDLKLQRQHSDPSDPLSNGVSDQSEELDKLSVNNSIALNVKSLNHNSVNNSSQPKVKLKETFVNHKSNKVGNNNWLPRLPTASSFDNGPRKGNECLKDYSSVPLLSKVDKPNDSIV